MDEERRKRARRTTMDQLEQGRIFPLPETIENGSNEGDTSDSESDEDLEFNELDFSGDEYDCIYDYEQEMEEDDVDPDQLTYEELIALGEMVGVESRGLSEAEINKHLHPLTCQSDSNLLIDRCVICQVEYEKGEKLVALHCDHPYHRDCIAQWLQIKKICPICNNDVSSKEVSYEDISNIEKHNE
ncbi:hypothetical protein BUALT_Bualt04G0063000 [Buddleja alternifolia]|uniref:RING-type domain-containing protein n=1 Tax=Buddleja alternifolia TaxID=168488 RepID=A0AAV6XNR2_9LAMI|nr:hypothetical protein BUALT_Bualt04G0063000 [Buddleja alternifolia]